MAKAKRIRIKCNAPATAGIKLVLVTRFDELLSWREGALNWNDPEGVHSMRVASRRLRSALRDFLPYVRKRRLGSVSKDLKRLAGALGDVRDHDVAILGLEEIQKHAPRESSAALKELIEARKAIREEARQELEAAITAEELQALQTEFVARVDEATALSERKRKHTDEPALTFADMSRAVILARLKEFEKLSNSLFKPLDGEALHDMRIAVKRLRYALELFQPCWPRSLATHAQRAARIQTALGDIHDCDVWLASTGKQIVRARKQHEHERIKGLVSLLSYFTKLRTKYLRRALARWCEWEAQDSSGKLRAALAPKEEAVEMPAMPAVVEAEATATQAAGEQMRQGL
jgi:CHAD domain-containing protein